MSDLFYTSVARVYAVSPKIAEVTDLTSSQIVEAFAAPAEAIINAKLSRMYTMPIVPAPPLLSAIADDITIYRILSRRIMLEGQTKDSTWPARFKESLDMLNEIASGAITLVGTGGDLITTRTDVAVAESNTQDYFPTFTEADFIDAVQDTTKLDDLAAERENN